MRTIERARKSVDETGRRYEAAFKSRISLFEKYNPCRVTSKLITCRECDSKINREVFGQKISLVNYVKCPVCGSYMVEKGNKLVCSQETCSYVEPKPKEEKED